MNDLQQVLFFILNQILNAGNAITAFSLLLYALTFNLRERTARTLALLLGCVALVYSTDVMSGTTQSLAEAEMWLRLQWIGISFTAPAYFHLSDALLAATGRPSRGRRKLIIRAAYSLAGVVLLIAGLTDQLVQGVVSGGPANYLEAGPLFPVFTVFFFIGLTFTGLNLWRAYTRCLTRTSRRRMRYLMLGAIAPLLGVYPFLTVIGGTVSRFPLLVWGSLAVVNMLVAGLMVLMSYSVAYFGVSIPDRVVKSRLFQWILRGPVVASTVLAVTVVVNRMSTLLGIANSRAIPLSTVLTLLLLQFVITLVRPTLERWLFYGEDRVDVERLHLLEERLLTTSDLTQYLDSILNAVCDVTDSPSAFIAVVNEEGLELEVAVGPDDPLRGSEDLPPLLLTDHHEELEELGLVVQWDRYWLIPLRSSQSPDLLGMMGFRKEEEILDLSEEVEEDLLTLRERAVIALADRLLQREVFTVVDRLVPQMEAVQMMRAAARYGDPEDLTSPLAGIQTEENLSDLVKDALGHYWGGPRLTRSPLMGMRVVQNAMEDHDGNPVNALRYILRTAMDRVRPEGERRFTAEWILFNILDLKFLEGRKVRDVARKLAMSEADLYRKQRVAIEEVARAIAEMEREAMAEGNEDKSDQ